MYLHDCMRQLFNFVSGGYENTILSHADDRPDLVKLFNFPVTPQSSMNVIERISAHYVQLGTILLQDGTGEIVQAIALSHNDRASACMYAVLRKWLNGSGRTPVTWSGFVTSLKDAELFSVASAIEAVLI